MNKRIYNRLRQRSYRYWIGGRMEKGRIWYEDRLEHKAYVRGVRDALDEVAKDIITVVLVILILVFGSESAEAQELAHAPVRVDTSTMQWFVNGEPSFYFGDPGEYDIPVLGDWDCNGTMTPGVYRGSNGWFYYANQRATVHADDAFWFGMGGDRPVVADWNGDGCDTVSIWRSGKFYVSNRLQTQVAEDEFWFGLLDDIPTVRNGVPGVYRESDFSIHTIDGATYTANLYDVVNVPYWDGKIMVGHTELIDVSVRVGDPVGTYPESTTGVGVFAPGWTPDYASYGNLQYGETFLDILELPVLPHRIQMITDAGLTPLVHVSHGVSIDELDTLADDAERFYAQLKRVCDDCVVIPMPEADGAWTPYHTKSPAKYQEGFEWHQARCDCPQFEWGVSHWAKTWFYLLDRHGEDLDYDYLVTSRFDRWEHPTARDMLNFIQSAIDYANANDKQAIIGQTGSYKKGADLDRFVTDLWAEAGGRGWDGIVWFNVSEVVDQAGDIRHSDGWAWIVR